MHDLAKFDVLKIFRVEDLLLFGAATNDQPDDNAAKYPAKANAARDFESPFSPSLDTTLGYST